MTSASPVPETPPVPSLEYQGEIVARPARYYRWTRYLISIGLLMGYGSLYFHDGFVTWPRDREKAIELERQGRHAEVKAHSELDINLNRAIGLTIPPLGLALLIWTLYNSRGRYRLSGNMLDVPGHPALPLDAIRQIDKTLWEKKGIAYIDYEMSGRNPDGSAGAATSGRLKLDDFVYEQEKTDAILKRIEQVVAPSDEVEGAAEVAETDAGGEIDSATATGAARGYPDNGELPGADGRIPTDERD